MKTPKCPYPDHKERKAEGIYPSEVKVLFGGHEVVGKGWLCEHCAKQFFIVETFKEENTFVKRATKATKGTNTGDKRA